MSTKRPARRPTGSRKPGTPTNRPSTPLSGRSVSRASSSSVSSYVSTNAAPAADAAASKRKTNRRPPPVQTRKTPAGSQNRPDNSVEQHPANVNFKSVAQATAKVMDQLASLYPDLKKDGTGEKAGAVEKRASIVDDLTAKYGAMGAPSQEKAPPKSSSPPKRSSIGAKGGRAVPPSKRAGRPAYQSSGSQRSVSPSSPSSARAQGKANQQRPAVPTKQPSRGSPAADGGGPQHLAKDEERADRAEHAQGPEPDGLLNWLGFSGKTVFSGQLYNSDPAPENDLFDQDALGEDDLLAFLDGKKPRAESAAELPTKPSNEETRDRQPSEENFHGLMQEKTEKIPALKDFVVECGLGTGGFAAVVLVTHKNDKKTYAIKVMNKSRIVREKQILRIGTERRVLQEYSVHPFIARMHYAYQNERQLFFVLDFCAGGDLYFHLTKFKNSRFKHFSEEATQFYVAELILALDHLHTQGVVYRDLKLENVMLDEEGHVKLVDFGLSKENVQVPCDEPLSPCGSILYMAPEMLDMTGGTSVDWWTLGILMHEMLTGHSPWKSETQNAVLKELRDTVPVKLSKELSSRAANMISGLANRNPRKRLGTRGAGELKAHPFFWPRLKRSNDWKKLFERQLKPPIRPCRTAPGTPQRTGRNSRNSRASSDGKRQYGTLNFEKSQRTLAIKAVAFPDASNEGSVGTVFDGFLETEGGPSIKPDDMAALKRMMARKAGRSS